MSLTTTFVHQHRDLVDVTTELDILLTGNPAESADEVYEVLSRLSKQLMGHLSIEDTVLYPLILSHADPSVRELALRFQSEVAGLSTLFTEYQRRWASPAAIAADPETFTDQTKIILGALIERIDKENLELFPHVD